MSGGGIGRHVKIGTVRNSQQIIYSEIRQSRPFGKCRLCEVQILTRSELLYYGDIEKKMKQGDFVDVHMEEGCLIGKVVRIRDKVVDVEFDNCILTDIPIEVVTPLVSF